MKQISKAIVAPVPIAPLVLFRILFGSMMLISVIRFAAMGWITELYVEPTFFFTYDGFDWVRPLGVWGMHGLFALMGLAAFGMMVGFAYRFSATLFFLSFTYVELIDKTNYLNHYYFVSLIGFLLIWLPAHRSFSMDVWRKPCLRQDFVPAWTLNCLKLQIGILYVFAGIAKLHPDWLFEAMPLKIWLPAQSSLTLIGPLLEQPWLAYAFSWFGALYDLFIVFFLLHRPTRPWAYGTVIIFHLMTGLLFPIGMFPYLMIALSLIFFSPGELPENLFYLKTSNPEVSRAGKNRQRNGRTSASGREEVFANLKTGNPRTVNLRTLLAFFFLIQLLLPFRYLVYPGELFWTEQGYRFSWRVMLMEKSGYATFYVTDAATDRTEVAQNDHYLTPVQEKMMATQPDMILQFAHHLADVYVQKGFLAPEVRVESYVSLNGHRSQLLIDPAVNLATQERGWQPKDWILPRNINAP